MIQGTRQIEREAADWIAKIEAADGDEELEAARDAWLARSLWHEVIYVRMEYFWPQIPDSLQSAQEHSGSYDVGDGERAAVDHWSTAAMRRPPEKNGPVTPLRHVRAFASKQLARAAVIALVLVGGVWLTQHTVLENETSVSYASASEGAASERKPIPLSDGSQIDLGRASKVEVRFSRSHRKLRLISGAARFSVAHDPKRSFEVIAGQVAARALGTRFTVRLNGDQDVTVGVEQGRVRVECQRALGESPSAGEPDCGSVLSPGDSVEIHFGRIALSLVAPQDSSVDGTGVGNGSFHSGSLSFTYSRT